MYLKTPGIRFVMICGNHDCVYIIYCSMSNRLSKKQKEQASLFAEVFYPFQDYVIELKVTSSNCNIHSIEDAYVNTCKIKVCWIYIPISVEW